MIGAAVAAAGAIIAAQTFAWFLFSDARLLLDAANPSLRPRRHISGRASRHAVLKWAARGMLLKSSFADSLPAKTIGAMASKLPRF